jgi:hypothetical protein
VAVVTIKDTFMGECCFIHPQDTFRKTRLTFMFTYKPLTVLEMRMTIMRHEAFDLHMMV